MPPVAVCKARAHAEKGQQLERLLKNFVWRDDLRHQTKKAPDLLKDRGLVLSANEASYRDNQVQPPKMFGIVAPVVPPML